MRRLYDSWSTFLENPPYKHIMGVPCKISPESRNFFHSDLERFKGGLEQHFGVEITPDALRQAISLFNRTRSLLQELYELKKADPPLISGTETLEVVLAGLVTPKEEYNTMLEGLLKELKAGPGSQSSTDDDGIRLMISGSELDDPDHVKLIESCGATVVIDDLCNGSRYFGELVDEKAIDPLEALAQRYLDRFPCARMRPQQIRVDHLQKLARDYKIDGLIYENIKFCGPYGGVFPIIRRAFKELDIPVLNLQRDYSGGGSGQVKTRVQAFLEQIGG
jgi:benzoyl-CoA reductase/2-hydroxyglutaryl-CoA dehydratase subunit BcrC/BadD/HgdB